MLVPVMRGEDVVAFCILSFLAGSLVMMVLFTLMDKRVEGKHAKPK